jgi:hypothetical protein
MRIAIIAAAAVLGLGLGLGEAAEAQPATPPPSDAAPAPPPLRHLDKCPDNLADYENSDATRKLVDKCLGRPESVSRGHGDDVIYHYSARGGQFILVFIFDKAGAMTHFRVYGRN